MQIMMIAVLDFSGFKSTVTALVNISKATFSLRRDVSL